MISMDEDRIYSDNLIDPVSVPNVDVDSERAVLCLCLKHDKALEKSAKSLMKDDFSDPRNACIYDSILALYIESRKIDRYTVADYIEDNGRINAAGGRDYLYATADMVAVLSNIDDYIAKVVEKSRLRKISKSLNKYLQMANSGRNSSNSIIDESVTELTNMRPPDDGVGFERLDKIVRDSFSNIKDIASGKVKPSVRTGFSMLDKKMGGMAPGSLNIIAARPGMGKTAFAINIAMNVALMQGIPVCIFSLEMSKAEIGNRVLAGRTKNVTSRDLQTANLKDDKEEQILNAIRELQNINIYVDDKSDVTPITMMGKLKELKSSGKLGLVIVDYIQLMSSGTGRGAGDRQNEIAYISRSLKLMAKEMEVPVIALSQLSRGAEKRDDHTPILSDLRDSGAIEQDADSVIFIDRPDYYHKDNGEEKKEINEAHIILAKNRKGETGKVNLFWWGRKTLFFEEDKDAPQDPNGTGSAPAPKQSGFTRTTDAASASGNFTFEQNDYAEGTYEQSGDASDDAGDFEDNMENDEFFTDSNDSYPPGMME